MLAAANAHKMNQHMRLYLDASKQIESQHTTASKVSMRDTSCSHIWLISEDSFAVDVTALRYLTDYHRREMTWNSRKILRSHDSIMDISNKFSAKYDSMQS
jgi:hypothetical protein